MKNNIPKMFRFGNIANSIYLGVGALFFVLGLILGIVGIVTENNALASSGWDMFGWGFYLALSAILCLIIVVGKQEKEALNPDNKSLAPFIVSGVFGIISSNPFYVIAAVFGIIVVSKENNAAEKEEPKQIEEPKE